MFFCNDTNIILDKIFMYFYFFFLRVAVLLNYVQEACISSAGGANISLLHSKTFWVLCPLSLWAL